LDDALHKFTYLLTYFAACSVACTYDMVSALRSVAGSDSVVQQRDWNHQRRRNQPRKI